MPKKLKGERQYTITVHVSADDYLSVDIEGEFNDERRADAAELLQRATPLLAAGIRLEPPKPPKQRQPPVRWEDREVTSWFSKEERDLILARPNPLERSPGGKVIWNRDALGYVLAMSEAGYTLNEIASALGTGTEYAKGRVRFAERRMEYTRSRLLG